MVAHHNKEKATHPLGLDVAQGWPTPLRVGVVVKVGLLIMVIGMVVNVGG